MFNQLNRRNFMTLAAGTALAATVPMRGFAQSTYPQKDITYLIPYNPGGLSDNISRLVGAELTKATGKNVINDYRPGAGGAIAANYYVGTKPDGYTIMQSTNSFYAIIPKMTKVEFNPDTDLTPLVLIGDAPMVIAAHPAVPAKTLKELIDYAKKNPGKLSYGSSGRGTVGHLCGEWLKAKAGADMLHIPYNGTPEAMQACISGEVQIMFGPESAPQIQAGALKGIAIMGDQRWSVMPDLPTTVESGIPGWAPRSWHTVTVLSKTPDDIKKKLSDTINGFLKTDEVKKKIVNFGLIGGIEDLAGVRKRANDDAAEFGKLIAEAGIGLK
ncbi:hypothetical protein PMI07_006301 [Rhizobium sp. CF080]|uniref:Bug family tripartite tricarboxylate transporter substrate binding protein n=1 Tax=Rhizobium sp. (strain CF080) TaxID=1144310 RepID=UPI0002718180|nr:tripartite tricarboxylate transporter substrate binding protein [Rhizobium sp. CF080]EUC00021.1 hypothetical protein PMI07_006301 [Rhizobium sp. CF080]